MCGSKLLRTPPGSNILCSSYTHFMRKLHNANFFYSFFFSVDNHITHFPFSPLKHMLIGSINGLDWTYRTESLTPHFSICQHCTQPEESDCGGPLTESGYFTLESQTAPLRHFNLQMLPVNEGDEMRDENERAPQLRRIHEKVSWHCVT